MTNHPVEDAIDTLRTDDWGALKSWFQENVLDDAPLSPAFLAQM